LILSTAGTGRINRRSMVSRLGHRVDLVDASGKEGVRVATTDEKLKLIMDHTGTTITLHADGKVVIEGTQGVTIDSSSAKHGAEGQPDCDQGHGWRHCRWRVVALWTSRPAASST
jgi:hypothetical protein